MDQRFEEKVARLYNLDEVNPQLHDEAFNQEEMKKTLEVARCRQSAIVNVAKCVGANATDEDNWLPSQFLASLDDARESGLTLSSSLVERYLYRENAAKFAAIKTQVEAGWKQMATLVSAVPAEVATPATEITQWCENCFDLD